VGGWARPDWSGRLPQGRGRWWVLTPGGTWARPDRAGWLPQGPGRWSAPVGRWARSGRSGSSQLGPRRWSASTFRVRRVQLPAAPDRRAFCPGKNRRPKAAEPASPPAPCGCGWLNGRGRCRCPGTVPAFAVPRRHAEHDLHPGRREAGPVGPAASPVQSRRGRRCRYRAAATTTGSCPVLTRHQRRRPPNLSGRQGARVERRPERRCPTRG
jgi:hypothetical protein